MWFDMRTDNGQGRPGFIPKANFTLRFQKQTLFCDQCVDPNQNVRDKTKFVQGASVLFKRYDLTYGRPYISARHIIKNDMHMLY